MAQPPTPPRLSGEAARLIPLSDVVETRGSLLPIDLADLPFRARRVFVVRGVPPGTTRGGHAHQRGAQLLVRLSGQIRVEVGAEGNSAPFLLADSRVGLGWVFASGRGPLGDRASTLHRRDRLGIHRRSNYFSVDTGKYSTAPWLALQVAEAIVPS